MPGQSRPGSVANKGRPGPGRYPDGRDYPASPRIVNPELAALSEPAADGPEDDAEARTDVLAAVTADRLWLETVLLSWESRYPIHQEAS